MKNRDLIKKLEESMPEWKDGLHGGYINKFLSELRKQDPNALVKISNGDCEADGIYAPAEKDGKLQPERAKPFKAGQHFPDGHGWIRVG